MKTVRVAEEFSRHPAGRFLTDGPFSGEAFRKKFLEPTLRGGDSILVELDGTRGYGSSFLEEAFGGLVRSGFQREEVASRIILQGQSTSLKREIEDYIAKAQRS